MRGLFVLSGMAATFPELMAVSLRRGRGERLKRVEYCPVEEACAGYFRDGYDFVSGQVGRNGLKSLRIVFCETDPQRVFVPVAAAQNNQIYVRERAGRERGRVF